MMNSVAYKLMYSFRKSKIWESIIENEIFAIKLPGNEIGYCSITGRSGLNRAVVVYKGQAGCSRLRETSYLDDINQILASDVMPQDCIMANLMDKQYLEEGELKNLKKYCKQNFIAFTPPFPHFARLLPYCIGEEIRTEDDWKAIETALTVVLKLAEKLPSEGKAGLGLRPISLKLKSEGYGDNTKSIMPNLEKVTIPLYTIENETLSQERIAFPPYVPVYSLETKVNDISVAKLKRVRQKGVYSCDILRLPVPMDGKPPFFPAMLVLLDDEGAFIPATLSEVPVYNSDRMVEELIDKFQKMDIFPKVICVRNEETKTLLKTFCSRAGITLRMKEDLGYLDIAAKNFISNMLSQV